MVVYTESRLLGGAEIVLGNLIEALSDRLEVFVVGFDADVVATVARRRSSAVFAVVPPIETKADIAAIGHLARLLRKIRADIFQATVTGPRSCRWGILAALLVPGTRVVAVEQLPMPFQDPWQRRVKLLLSHRLDAHVACGERAARLVEGYVGLAHGSVISVPNGVPDRGPTVRSPRRGADLVVGSLGRLDHQKGYDVLLRALPMVPGVRVEVVGDGPEAASLRQQARTLGVSDRFELAGWLDDPRPKLSHFDAFVLPSRFEGLPLAILEAMLAGLPVVASDVGSVAEAVVDGRTGLLVEPEDPVALAGALRRLTHDSDLRRSLGSAARAAAAERYTSTVMARSYEHLYQCLVTA
jgi:glycosyltransferase involved in cell wall biosynthesis